MQPRRPLSGSGRRSRSCRRSRRRGGSADAAARGRRARPARGASRRAGHREHGRRSRCCGGRPGRPSSPAASSLRPGGRPGAGSGAAAAAGWPASARRRGRRCVAYPAPPSRSRGRTRSRMTQAARSPVEEAVPQSRRHRTVRRVPILAHIDLDAFYAAVEELEDPTLRTKPLVVGGDPQGRGVVATANYVARRFGIHSAMSSAEALRRCPEPSSCARGTPSTGSTPRPSGARSARSSPGRAGGDRRGLPRPRHRRDLVRREHARSRRRCRRRCRRRRRSPARSAFDLEGRLQGRLGPTQARRDHGCPTRDGGSLPRPVSVAHCPGSARRPRSGSRAAGVKTIGDLATLSDTELRAVLPGLGRTASARSRAGDRPTRPRARAEARVDLGRGDLRAGHLRPHDPPRRDPAYGRRARRPHATQRVQRPHRHGEAALRGLLDPLPLDHLAAPVDEGERIGELACGLLDRGLRDRPGALRLVGVGVSGLSDYRQLTLEQAALGRRPPPAGRTPLIGEGLRGHCGPDEETVSSTRLRARSRGH